VWGTPVNVDSITATLYYGSQQEDLSSLVENIDTGLYRISYAIPTGAPEGTWAIAIKARYLSLAGTAMDTFLISSTLTDWNAQLISIDDNIATIQTNIGVIKANLTAINARIVEVKDNVATIITDLGTLEVKLADLVTTTTEVKDKLPTDTGTIALILYVTTIFSVIAAILLVYRLIKKS